MTPGGNQFGVWTCEGCGSVRRGELGDWALEPEEGTVTCRSCQEAWARDVIQRGFEELDWATWHMLTGRPRQAYDEWLELDAVSRRDVVELFQDPDALAELVELAGLKP